MFGELLEVVERTEEFGFGAGILEVFSSLTAAFVVLTFAGLLRV